jgi:hypothetical protein
MEMMKCDKYSVPFEIIINPLVGLPGNIPSGINEDVRAKSMFDKMQQFIVNEQAKTDAEIRRLTTEMNVKREQAQKDFQHIMNIINIGTTTINQSTNSLSNENMSLTPPITPEQMTIDDQMKLPHTLMTMKQHPKMTVRDGSAKHTNAIHHQHITRTINFDDDIFEDTKNETNRYHKYSDTEEASDAEEAVEKRPITRVRPSLAALNIARSAPISMPQFMHHAMLQQHQNHHDNKAEAAELDIASSIKFLAKSIHADPIFGDLPRPILRYNTEF